MSIKIYGWIFFLFLLTGFVQGQPSTELASLIKSVENGLRPSVLLHGDTTWSIAERMQHYGVPGVSIAVIKDYKIHWSKSYGVMDLETKRPVSNNTLFQAGSISKPVAAYGALHLVDQGQLSLTAPIQNYLKSWQIPSDSFMGHKTVILQHLLSHTGGVTVHGFLGYNVYEKVPTLIQVLNGEAPANSPPIKIDKLPGETFRYSGGGFCIMQQMMIDQTEKSFPESLKDLVLDPLQMTNSTYEQPLPADKLLWASTGYLPDGSMTKGKRHIYPEMAAAGLWTTAADLAKFAIDIQMSFLGQGNKVLSREMTRKMLTAVYEDFVGLGIFLEDKQGEIYFGHGGWDEGFSSDFSVHRDRGYGVVILTNANHPDFINELKRSVAQTYSWQNYLPPIYESISLDSVQVQPFLGRYNFSSNQIASVFLEKNKLYIQYLRNPPEQLLRISDNIFVRREREKLITFAINPEDAKKYVVFQDEGSRDQYEYVHARLDDSEKIPYEWIELGEYVKAQEAYEELLKTNPSDPDIQESQINRVGYQLLEQGYLQQAIDVFRINVHLYPTSYNVYDSLGEAYLAKGEKANAILNYQKSLDLNSANEHAKKVIIDLQKE